MLKWYTLNALFCQFLALVILFANILLLDAFFDGKFGSFGIRQVGLYFIKPRWFTDRVLGDSNNHSILPDVFPRVRLLPSSAEYWQMKC